jgi:hypothetical protein
MSESKGIYTGFFPDMSAGVTFGLKLPTGNDNHDLPSLLIATPNWHGQHRYAAGRLLPSYAQQYYPGLYWFAQRSWMCRCSPKVDIVRASNWIPPSVSIIRACRSARVNITPVAQVIPTYRSKDTGPWASGGVNDPGVNPKDPTEVDSGYHRMLLSPGIEFDIHPVMIYADAEFDDLQWSKGNQLVAPILFKVVVSYVLAVTMQ